MARRLVRPRRRGVPAGPLPIAALAAVVFLPVPARPAPEPSQGADPNSAAPASASLLERWGAPGAFPAFYRESVDAFFAAEKAYRNADYRRASAVLTAFWSVHPPGSQEWAAAGGEAQSIARTTGANFGTPACYSALRMLTDCTEWRLRAPPAGRPEPRAIRSTVVLVGRSSGKQPSSLQELRAGRGPTVRHTLDRGLTERGREPIGQSLYLFTDYLQAITDGRLTVQVKVLPLPDLEVPVEIVERSLPLASGTMGAIFADLAPDALPLIWRTVGSATIRATDWWWVLYPSHVPGLRAAFPPATGFITGGTGVGPDGASPAFLIDDLWLLRVPGHLGSGPYSEAERRAYLPQWFQHEFFHHLFRTYPGLKLEGTSHQWFDRSAWPGDFEGRLEADYFSEAVHKRLRTVQPPLHVALRYAPPSDAVLRQITPRMLCGRYRAEPVANQWLAGAIECPANPRGGSGQTLRWRNAAGVAWLLTFDGSEGLLRTGADDPYHAAEPVRGRAFRIALRRNAEGDYKPRVAGFWFLNSFYAKLPDP